MVKTSKFVKGLLKVTVQHLVTAYISLPSLGKGGGGREDFPEALYETVPFRSHIIIGPQHES